jgi:hypothetical protein
MSEKTNSWKSVAEYGESKVNGNLPKLIAFMNENRESGTHSYFVLLSNKDTLNYKIYVYGESNKDILEKLGCLESFLGQADSFKVRDSNGKIIIEYHL